MQNATMHETMPGTFAIRSSSVSAVKSRESQSLLFTFPQNVVHAPCKRSSVGDPQDAESDF